MAKCAFGQDRAAGKSELLTPRCDIRPRLENVAEEWASVGYLEVPDAMTSSRGQALAQFGSPVNVRYPLLTCFAGYVLACMWALESTNKLDGCKAALSKHKGKTTAMKQFLIKTSENG